MTGSWVQRHPDPQLGGTDTASTNAGRVARPPAPESDRAGAGGGGQSVITETGNPGLAARALEIPSRRPPDSELLGGRPPEQRLGFHSPITTMPTFARGSHRTPAPRRSPS